MQNVGHDEVIGKKAVWKVGLSTRISGQFLKDGRDVGAVSIGYACVLMLSF